MFKPRSVLTNKCVKSNKSSGAVDKCLVAEVETNVTNINKHGGDHGNNDLEKLSSSCSNTIYVNSAHVIQKVNEERGREQQRPVSPPTTEKTAPLLTVSSNVVLAQELSNAKKRKNDCSTPVTIVEKADTVIDTHQQLSLSKENLLREMLLRKMFQEKRRKLQTTTEDTSGATTEGSPPGSNQISTASIGMAIEIDTSVPSPSQVPRETDLDLIRKSISLTLRDLQQAHSLLERQRSGSGCSPPPPVSDSLGDAGASEAMSTQSALGLDLPPMPQHQSDNAAEDGYYSGRPSDSLGNYRVMSLLGKGMFSSVLRCRDRSNGLVAIKVMRKTSTTDGVGEKELDVLSHLMAADPADSKHVVRLAAERSFLFEGHFCLVLENMNINLRKYCKQYGQSKTGGLAIETVKSFAFQLYTALKHVHGLGYIHGDIKPDNIVVDDSLARAKLCDFGAALTSPADQKDMRDNAYLAARYYRAPEVVLCCGNNKTPAIDVWALAVTLVEVLKGSVALSGDSNNELLWSIVSTIGPIPRRMIRIAAHQSHLEEADGNVYFLRRSRDKVTGKEVVRRVPMPPAPPAGSDISALIMKRATSAGDKSKAGTGKDLATLFRDLVVKSLVIDPVKRASAMMALNEAFFKDH